MATASGVEKSQSSESERGPRILFGFFDSSTLRLFDPGTLWALVVAALAMVATLPGRTHGLGLITEPLLADLGIGRVTFALVNLWATLLGAAFCLPVGWLLDRVSGRVVLLGVTVGLSVSVVGMSRLPVGLGVWLVPALFGLVLLTRGLGQSALSVVSLALMGRAVASNGPVRTGSVSDGRENVSVAGASGSDLRLRGAGRVRDVRKDLSGLGVGFYSFVTALGFMSAFATVKRVYEGWEPGWRALWGGIGVGVAVYGLLAFLVIRPGRREKEGKRARAAGGSGLTLTSALGTPAFWVFAGATSLYGLVAAGVSLFNQSILAERGFDRGVFLTITAVTPLVGLAANLATGWLAGHLSSGRLLAASMLILTAALLCFPWVRALWQVYLYAVAMGVAGGMVTVLFFGIWSRAFGTTHLGKIQGAAQMLTVLASAVGPLLLAAGQEAFGSYVPVFRYVAVVAGLFAVAAWVVPLPRFDPASGSGG